MTRPYNSAQPQSGSIFADSTNFTSTVYVRQIQQFTFLLDYLQILINITTKLRYVFSK